MNKHLSRILSLGFCALGIMACSTDAGDDGDDDEEQQEEEGFTESAIMRTACIPKQLSASCNCEEVARRYERQYAICHSTSARCTSSTNCGATDRVMRISRQCINARQELARCYRNPTAGLNALIRMECNRFRACIPKSQACGTDAPVMPDVCR
jgi:hypothetical protein